MLQVLFVFLTLALVIFLVFKKWNIILVSIVAAAVLAILDGQNILTALTDTFMSGASTYVKNFFLLFCVSALFGKVMEETGAAAAIAKWLTKLLGEKFAILGVFFAGMLLTYGGISALVIAFTMYPIALAVFKSANLPRRLIPGVIAAGCFTFAATAFPGTPQTINLIPPQYIGTTVNAAPVLGIVCGLIGTFLLVIYVYHEGSAARKKGDGFEADENTLKILAEAESTIENISRNFRRGLLTEEERYKAVIETWKEADDEITEALLTGLDKYNNIFMMADSGARGSDKQIKQLAGMRGLMADTSGRTIELPIKSNFREGLDVLEYFISAHGARKGLSDTALRTADSGYLTRRLVDVSQDLIIRETDCCEGKDEIPGMWISAFMDGKEVIETLEERITGRYACDDMYDDEGELIVKANHMITPKRAARIVNTKAIIDAGDAAKVKIRTILTCKSHIGICAKCYGSNMATGEPVQVGEAVGIIAAQSIGEPGTQLTMRTFHTGGVAGDDITQGLPRVEELFEARKPKGLAIISEFGGKVTLRDTKKKREVIITDEENAQTKAYLIPYGSRIKVMDGQVLEAGDELTEGSVNPHDIMKIKGVRAVQDYMLREVQRVYRLQGVEINDKHIEVIVRQMLKKVRIENNGDSDFLPGTMVDTLEYEDKVEELAAEGKEVPEGKQIILGITKASLATNSFLSAASFQETTKVLTDAAIKGKIDPLIGLKENVILGKLIPAGTGMKRYRNISLHSDLVASLEPPEPVEEPEEKEEGKGKKGKGKKSTKDDKETDIVEDDELLMMDEDEDDDALDIAEDDFDEEFDPVEE